MSNILTITHTTEYQYRTPMRFGRHRLVLRPREGHDLHVDAMELDIAPASQVEWSRDVFGNSIASVDFLEAAAELSIVSRATIRRADSGRKSPMVHNVPFPIVYDELEQRAATVYQYTIYPDEMAAVANWVNKITSQCDRETDAFSRVVLINQAIQKQIRYKRRETKGVQTPMETLNEGSGSCRDMATLLLEACRSLGIAARFGSGYLDCAAARTGTASTHAWGEVYFPEWGWTGFDPTLGERTHRGHIVMGVSNHPRGVMPVSGRFFGNSLDFVGMNVAVRIETEEPLENIRSANVASAIDAR